MKRFHVSMFLGVMFGCITCVAMAQSSLPNNAASKRVIYYDQTIYNGSSSSSSNYVSLSPLWAAANINPSTNQPYVTDVIVAAFHIGAQSDGSSIHLNDNQPSDAIFATLWQEVSTLQGKGVNVLAMVGGAAQGSYAALFDSSGNLTSYYTTLKQMLQTYKLNGVDLDIEESVSQSNIETLINQLRSDFGSNFLITMAPVASSLQGGSDPFSGFNYTSLYAAESSNISWFNTQFYSGFGSLSSSSDYVNIVNAGFPANKVVAGMLSNSANGSGYVDVGTVESTVQNLVTTYSNFGGVDAWEYYNANPGGTSNPAEWGTAFGQTMNTQVSSTPVNLSSFYNVNGIYTDGTSFSSTGGLDSGGYAYSSHALGTSLVWNSSSFTFGPANSADAVSNQTVTLTSGKFSKINILATGIEGNQISQSFKATYTDSSSTTFTQNVSDWFTPQSYSGESKAVTMSYRDTSAGAADNRTFYLYGYSFSLDNTKAISNIQLPANRNVVTLAIALQP